MLHVPFANLTPSATVEIHEGESIQQALDANPNPGTLFAVHGGVYQECVKFNHNGTPTAPIWLTSVDGIGAACIRFPATPTRKDVLTGLGRKCIYVHGFEVDGMNKAENSIHFGLSGSDVTQLALYVEDIVVEACYAHNSTKDNIKISQGNRIWIVRNHCAYSNSDQNIDFVAVDDGVIFANLCEYAKGPVALFVKGGSRRCLVANNTILNAALEGLQIGGSGDPVWNRPGTLGFQSQDCFAIENYVHGQGKRAILLTGAQRAGIYRNYLGAGVIKPLAPLTAINKDNNGWASLDCDFVGNVFQQQANAFAPVQAGCSYRDCATGKAPWASNAYDNVWPALMPVGNAYSLPLLWGMPT